MVFAKTAPSCCALAQQCSAGCGESSTHGVTAHTPNKQELKNVPNTTPTAKIGLKLSSRNASKGPRVQYMRSHRWKTPESAQ